MEGLQASGLPAGTLVYLGVGVAILAWDMVLGPGMPVNQRHSRVFWSLFLGAASAFVLAWPLVVAIRLLRRRGAPR